MTHPCPICQRPVEKAPADRGPADKAYAPFCSKRCADVDLQRWFAGVYAVPGEDQADTDAPTDEDRED